MAARRDSCEKMMKGQMTPKHKSFADRRLIVMLVPIRTVGFSSQTRFQVALNHAGYGTATIGTSLPTICDGDQMIPSFRPI